MLEMSTYMGSLFRRGNVWWVKYYQNGRPIRERTGAMKETEAKRVLKEREGRVAMGQPVLRRADRISYEEVAKDLREHYQTTGTRNMEEAEYRLKHLDGFFAGQRIAGINPARIIAYVAKRQEEGAANATINRELETLGKMLKLAYENNKLHAAAHHSQAGSESPLDRDFLSLTNLRLSAVSFALTINLR
jgi:hypothetical protein